MTISIDWLVWWNKGMLVSGLDVMGAVMWVLLYRLIGRYCFYWAMRSFGCVVWAFGGCFDTFARFLRVLGVARLVFWGVLGFLSVGVGWFLDAFFIDCVFSIVVDFGRFFEGVLRYPEWFILVYWADAFSRVSERFKRSWILFGLHDFSFDCFFGVHEGF